MRIGTGVYLSRLIVAVLLLFGCPRTPAPSNQKVKGPQFQDLDASRGFLFEGR